jgi:hypothetical protein
LAVTLSGVLDYLKEMYKADRETRDRIIRRLEQCRFRTWEEITKDTGHLPGGAGNPPGK